MSDLLTYDRLTPNRARQIADAISNDPKNVSGLIRATISSLAELIPDTGSFRAHLIEDALLKTAATHRIFKLAGSDGLDHFASQRLPHSLLEYVFFATVQGKTLREIVEGIPARCRSKNRGELWIDAGKFNFRKAL